MKDNNILCKIKKSFNRTTNSAHNYKKYPNLIKNIVAKCIKEIRHADKTYIRVLTSFVYQVAIIDAYSRKIAGYKLGKTLSAYLTIEALKDAIPILSVSRYLILCSHVLSFTPAASTINTQSRLATPNLASSLPLLTSTELIPCTPSILKYILPVFGLSDKFLKV